MESENAKLKKMEMEKNNNGTPRTDMPFSRAIKAGKRLYYIDVKESKGGECFLTLTESKKVYEGDEDNPQVTFEKHKIFLYPEDFHKVLDALSEAVDYVEARQGKAEPRKVHNDTDIRIDVEF